MCVEMRYDPCRRADIRVCAVRPSKQGVLRLLQLLGRGGAVLPSSFSMQQHVKRVGYKGCCAVGTHLAASIKNKSHKHPQDYDLHICQISITGVCCSCWAATRVMLCALYIKGM